LASLDLESDEEDEEEEVKEGRSSPVAAVAAAAAASASAPAAPDAAAGAAGRQSISVPLSVPSATFRMWSDKKKRAMAFVLALVMINCLDFVNFLDLGPATEIHRWRCADEED
jgi:3-oxoacyl-ACP reductase-like protein